MQGSTETMIFILKNSKQRRASHWNEIRKRITTHEGEVLSGRRGDAYQQKYGKKYLGTDLSRYKPVTEDQVKKYEKTGR